MQVFRSTYIAIYKEGISTDRKIEKKGWVVCVGNIDSKFTQLLVDFSQVKKSLV